MHYPSFFGLTRTLVAGSSDVPSSAGASQPLGEVGSLCFDQGTYSAMSGGEGCGDPRVLEALLSEAGFALHCLCHCRTREPLCSGELASSYRRLGDARRASPSALQAALGKDSLRKRSKVK